MSLDFIEIANFLFSIHLLSTFYMLGLIWVVQLAHYPFFQFIDPTREIEAHGFHRRRISLVVIPFSFLEVSTGLALILFEPAFMSDFQSSLNISLMVLTWACTFTLQVPLHHQLSKIFDQKLVRRLVATNWIRTSFWTLRSALLFYILVGAF